MGGIRKSWRLLGDISTINLLTQNQYYIFMYLGDTAVVLKTRLSQVLRYLECYFEYFHISNYEFSLNTKINCTSQQA